MSSIEHPLGRRPLRAKDKQRRGAGEREASEIEASDCHGWLADSHGEMLILS